MPVLCLRLCLTAGRKALIHSIGVVWHSIIQPDRALRPKFLTCLLRPLDDAGCLAAGGGAAEADLPLLGFIAALLAELPYRKLDEPLAVLSALNAVISRRADTVMTEFQGHRAKLAMDRQQASGEGRRWRAGVIVAAGVQNGSNALPDLSCDSHDAPPPIHRTRTDSGSLPLARPVVRAAPHTPGHGNSGALPGARHHPGHLGAVDARHSAGRGDDDDESGGRQRCAAADDERCVTSARGWDTQGGGQRPGAGQHPPLYSATPRKRAVPLTEADRLNAAVKASVAVSLLLVVKAYLRCAYDLSEERLQKFDPSAGAGKKAEERVNAVKNPNYHFSLGDIKLTCCDHAGGSAEGAAAVERQYQTLKLLMKQDEVEYRHSLGRGGVSAAIQDAATAMDDGDDDAGEGGPAGVATTITSGRRPHGPDSSTARTPTAKTRPATKAKSAVKPAARTPTAVRKRRRKSSNNAHDSDVDGEGAGEEAEEGSGEDGEDYLQESKRKSSGGRRASAGASAPSSKAKRRKDS
ncbi:MAG: hypothetical protein WDW36_006329 [Sanguina aurantia]